MNILVIIPAYNEEASIGKVIRSIQKALPQADIVVVNDGSSDATSQAARACCPVRVIDLPVNLGIGGAMQTGYLFAHRQGYELALQVDADGQHDALEMSKIIEPVLRGEADCCIGSRFLAKTSYRSAWSRRAGIWFFAWMIHWMVGKLFTDPTSGFRAVNARVIERFAAYYPEDYPEVEAIVYLERQNLRVQEVSVQMHSRQSGRSSITPLKSLYYMLKVTLAVFITRIRNVS